MKKITKNVSIRVGAIAFSLICLLAFVGPSESANIPKGAIHLVVHSADKANKDVVQRVMDVENPEATFSGLTKLLDKETGFIKIWGQIGNNEATYMYNDSLILINRYHVKKVIITLNSGGGSAFAGLGMADTILAMRKAGVEIECHTLGYVASAAVPVLAVCGKRIATPNCLFMVHEGKLMKFLVQETASDLVAQQKMMSLMGERYIKLLADHSKLSVEDWEAKEKITTWFTTKDALKWGLIDEIR